MILRKQRNLKGLLRGAVVACLISGCTHTSVKPDNSAAPLTVGERVMVPVASASPAEVQSFRVTDPEIPKVADAELDLIPTEVNERVDQWVKYFQGKGRPHMERYLARSGRYMKVMQTILKKNGLPEDLIYIALIESGFSSKATSHASAVGYWQFIRGTGKRYGLEITGLVDERRDPIMATQAASEYFKGLYSVFGSWYLAMASYNVGENRVKREVMNHYTRDFWELARKRRLPKETINYIPKFIAAKMIGNDPAKYGFTDIEWEKPLEFETIKVDRAVNLKQMAAKMNYDYDDLKQMNPKFKGEIAPAKNNGNSAVLELRVPVGQTVAALAAAQGSFAGKVEFIADAGDTTIHRVSSGESLYTIARKYRSSVALIRDLNDLKAGRKLRIGMRLQVPERGSAKKAAMALAKAGTKADSKVESKKAKPVEVAAADEGSETTVAAEKATEAVEINTAEGKVYVVQAGDTLSGIADDYDSTVNELRKLNKLRRGKLLKIGMHIKVPSDDQGIPVAPDSDQVVPSRGPQAVAPIAHVVKPGETLASIAQKYGVSVSSLKRANNLKQKSLLKVGSRLVIPVSASKEVVNSKASRSAHAIVQPRNQRAQARNQRVPKVHVVRRGENLGHIAEKYDVSVAELRSRNRISSGSKLFVGVRLMIPQAQASIRE